MFWVALRINRSIIVWLLLSTLHGVMNEQGWWRYGEMHSLWKAQQVDNGRNCVRVNPCSHVFRSAAIITHVPCISHHCLSSSSSLITLYPISHSLAPISCFFYLLFPLCFLSPLPALQYRMHSSFQCSHSMTPPGVVHSWWMIKNCRSSLVKIHHISPLMIICTLHCLKTYSPLVLECLTPWYNLPWQMISIQDMTKPERELAIFIWLCGKSRKQSTRGHKAGVRFANEKKKGQCCGKEIQWNISWFYYLLYSEAWPVNWSSVKWENAATKETYNKQLPLWSSTN